MYLLCVYMCVYIYIIDRKIYYPIPNRPIVTNIQQSLLDNIKLISVHASLAKRTQEFCLTSRNVKLSRI